MCSCHAAHAGAGHARACRNPAKEQRRAACESKGAARTSSGRAHRRCRSAGCRRPGRRRRGGCRTSACARPQHGVAQFRQLLLGARRQRCQGASQAFRHRPVLLQPAMRHVKGGGSSDVGRNSSHATAQAPAQCHASAITLTMARLLGAVTPPESSCCSDRTFHPNGGPLPPLFRALYRHPRPACDE